MVTQTPLHIATARPVGLACRSWARSAGYNLVGMDECEVFVRVLYDKILPASYLAATPPGSNGRPRRCYNFHPGILPQYRGAGAFSWAIINGERETGVTLHEIDGDIDHGPIIDQWGIGIGKLDTAHTLFIQACKIIEYTFRAFLPHLLTGNYQAVPQDESLARFYPRKALDQAKDITRFARAFHFPGKEQAWYRTASGERVYLEYDG